MHVVLPADGGIRAEVTEDLVVRLRRELALSDRDRRCEAAACARASSASSESGVARFDHRRLRPLAAEREVDRFGDRPRPAVALAQSFLRAQRVDRRPAVHAMDSERCPTCSRRRAAGCRRADRCDRQRLSAPPFCRQVLPGRTRPRAGTRASAREHRPAQHASCPNTISTDPVEIADPNSRARSSAASASGNRASSGSATSDMSARASSSRSVVMAPPPRLSHSSKKR